MRPENTPHTAILTHASPTVQKDSMTDDDRVPILCKI